MDKLRAVAVQFESRGKIIDIREYGNGNINNTFLVTLDTGESTHFILQRINTMVFHHPESVVQNMRTVSDHVIQRLHHAPPVPGRRWEVPQVLSTEDGKDYLYDSDGSFWRAISFVDHAHSFDTIQDIHHARETGCALGMFHSLISDLPVDRLADTLRGFHITPLYLNHYNEVKAKWGEAKSDEENYCFQFVRERGTWANVLENARARGDLCLRPIHGDPKVNNIMIDTTTGNAVSIVDLDTVKPGLVHYDIGDCLRSGCNPHGEETVQWEDVYFDTDLCEAILHGYISYAREFLTDNDYHYLYEAVRLLTFELGLRFFTDYLEGNVYFKAAHAKHNLERALVQFKLTDSIESRENVIRAIIRDIR